MTNNIIANYLRPCFETADYSTVAEKLFRGLMVTLCRLSVKEMLQIYTNVILYGPYYMGHIIWSIRKSFILVVRKRIEVHLDSDACFMI